MNGQQDDKGADQQIFQAVWHSNKTVSASTEYYLANPGREYLVYLPANPKKSTPLNNVFFRHVVTVDLSDSQAIFGVEWFNSTTEKVIKTGTRIGDKRLTIPAPFAGDAVLYIYKR